ncbi:MAG TPA: CDP-alcohol phosphatidyltransferase family protein [Polyangiaceae bacterium]
MATSSTPGSTTTRTTASSALLPDSILTVAVERLSGCAALLADAGVSATAVTLARLVLAALGGLLLGFGVFSWAAVLMVCASLGDAIDGLVARRTHTASPGGALLDASVDRYEEFFFLGGLAIHFRDSALLLALALTAIAGSFMVSYGSAKAEAAGVPVPPGVMRRPERAICLCLGVSLSAIAVALKEPGTGPTWVPVAPIFVALGGVALLANVSAVARLRHIARISGRWRRAR